MGDFGNAITDPIGKEKLTNYCLGLDVYTSKGLEECVTSSNSSGISIGIYKNPLNSVE